MFLNISDCCVYLFASKRTFMAIGLVRYNVDGDGLDKRQLVLLCLVLLPKSINCYNIRSGLKVFGESFSIDGFGYTSNNLVVCLEKLRLSDKSSKQFQIIYKDQQDHILDWLHLNFECILCDLFHLCLLIKFDRQRTF